MTFDISTTPERWAPAWTKEFDASPDALPYVRYRPPTGFEVVEYRRSLADFKRDNEIDGEAGSAELLDMPKFVEFLASFALPRIVSIHNISAGGQELTWDEQKLEEVNLTKRDVLGRMGRSGLESVYTLFALVNYMLSGFSDDEKKTSSAQSESVEVQKASDAPAPSAPENTTATSNSTSESESGK